MVNNYKKHIKVVNCGGFVLKRSENTYLVFKDERLDWHT